MRQRPLILSSLVLLVLALVAPAGAAADGLTARWAPTGGTATAGAAFAADGCFGDRTGDVRNRVDGPVVGGPQADITSFCASYTAAGLDLSVQFAAVTNPVTDPAWDDFKVAVAVPYELADGTQRIINLGKQRGNGAFEYYVLQGQFSPTLVCAGPATATDTGYGASIPADCLQGPDSLVLQAQMLYGAQGTSDADLFDIAPGDGGAIVLPREAPPGADRIERLAGPSRLETAIATSQASFGDGQADAVILALADNFPDALVAAPLAQAEEAPVLLTPGGSVPDVVLDEIDRALGGTGQVILLGGTAALSPAVADAVEDAGHDVRRIAGDGRFDTAVDVARAANPAPKTIFLADGGDFPDALIAGATAPQLGGVAVLVGDGGVPQVVQDYLGEHPDADVVAIGPVAAQVAPDATAISTFNPAATSALLYNASNRDATRIAVASVDTFPDGLTGGAYAAREGIPLVLTPRDAMENNVLDILTTNGPFAEITVMGGEVAVSTTVAGQLAAVLQ